MHDFSGGEDGSEGDSAFVGALRGQGYDGNGKKRPMGDAQPSALTANSSASSNRTDTPLRKKTADASSGQRKSTRRGRSGLLSQVGQFAIIEVEVAGGLPIFYMEKYDLGELGMGNQKNPI